MRRYYIEETDKGVFAYAENDMLTRQKVSGRWCKYEDVSKVEQENERLKTELDGISEKCAQDLRHLRDVLNLVADERDNLKGELEVLRACFVRKEKTFKCHYCINHDEHKIQAQRPWEKPPIKCSWQWNGKKLEAKEGGEG